MGEVPYTRRPRSTLWLLRGDEVTIGGPAPDQGPRFVTEVRSLYIGKAPITNEEYEVYDQSHERGPTSTGDRDPVVNVSFYEALGYCRWYAAASGKSFRLPTEIEWEFSCRAGGEGRTFWRGDLRAGDAYVWDAETAGGRCHEIESKRANGFGLHDLLGNVWEWTSSLFLPYPPEEGDGREDPDRPGPRVIRGGSFRTPRAELDCAARVPLDPDERRDDLGFRIARYL